MVLAGACELCRQGMVTTGLSHAKSGMLPISRWRRASFAAAVQEVFAVFPSGNPSHETMMRSGQQGPLDQRGNTCLKQPFSRLDCIRRATIAEPDASE